MAMTVPSAWTMQPLPQAVSCLLWPKKRKIVWQLGINGIGKRPFFVCVLNVWHCEGLLKESCCLDPQGNGPRYSCGSSTLPRLNAGGGCSEDKQCKVADSNCVQPTQFTRTSSLFSKANFQIMMGTSENIVFQCSYFLKYIFINYWLKEGKKL